MTRMTILAALLLALLAVAPATAAETSGAAPPPQAGPPPPPDDEMLDDAPGAFDVSVTAAAPRAAIAGRAGFLMLVPRPGRVIHVAEREAVRFISGVKEAVWYAGSGAVESALDVFAPQPDGARNLLGRDRIVIRGAAPKIDAGRVRVDVPFPSPGEYPLEVIVRNAVNPRHGRAVRRAHAAHYTVRVWPAGELGSVAGFVGNEADGAPLPGFQVVAIDAGSREIVAAAPTRCDGTYEIRRLPPGDYLIAVHGAHGFLGEFYDDVIDPALATPVGVTGGPPAGPIDFLLARP